MYMQAVNNLVESSDMNMGYSKYSPSSSSFLVLVLGVILFIHVSKLILEVLEVPF